MPRRQLACLGAHRLTASACAPSRVCEGARGKHCVRPAQVPELRRAHEDHAVDPNVSRSPVGPFGRCRCAGTLPAAAFVSVKRALFPEIGGACLRARAAGESSGACVRQVRPGWHHSMSARSRWKTGRRAQSSIKENPGSTESLPASASCAHPRPAPDQTSESPNLNLPSWPEPCASHTGAKRLRDPRTPVGSETALRCRLRVKPP